MFICNTYKKSQFNDFMKGIYVKCGIFRTLEEM